MKIFFLIALFLPSIAWTSEISTEPGEGHDHSDSGCTLMIIILMKDICMKL